MALPFKPTVHLEIDRIWIDCSMREQHGMSAQPTQFPVEDGPNISDHVRLMPDTLHLEALVTNTPTEQPKSHYFSYTLQEGPVSLVDAEGALIKTAADRYKTTPIEGEPIVAWLGLLPRVGNRSIDDILTRDPRRYEPRRKLSMGTTESDLVPTRRSMTALRPMPLGSFAYDPRFSPRLAPERVQLVAQALRETFTRRTPITIITAFRQYDQAVLTDLSVSREADAVDCLRFSAQAQVLRIVNIAHSTTPAEVRAEPAKQRGTQATQPAKPGEIPQAIKDDSSALRRSIDRYNTTPPAPGN